MQGKLTFETDYDFSILYKGELYANMDFSISKGNGPKNVC